MGLSEPWSRPEHQSKDYEGFGDAYDDDKYRDLRREWEWESSEDSYLSYVKDLTRHGWVNLRLLADFMQIGTHPLRWPGMKSAPDFVDKRQKRFKATEVSILDFYEGKVEKIAAIHDIKGLELQLKEDAPNNDIQLRLYVVEDLSTEVIEKLGTKFNVEPDVFRAHIVDYAWYNVRDRWRDPPYLEVVRRQAKWTQFRYISARYFPSRKDFTDARASANEFNIFRRPDDDLSNKAWWDSSAGVVGLTRSRATFWLSDDESQTGVQVPIGILLLDPTLKQGFPLWRGRRILHPTPRFGSDRKKWPKSPVPLRDAQYLRNTELRSNDNPNSDTWPERKLESNGLGQGCGSYETSFYNDFLYWAQHPGVSPDPAEPKVQVPVQILLHLICSEWRTMTDYVKTRLSQVDLEIVKPQQYAAGNDDEMLQILHVWRRYIPLYREMVDETLRRIRQPPYSHIGGPKVGPGQGDAQVPGPSHCFEEDFKLVLWQLDEYQSRINQLTSVTTAVKSFADNHNIRRLTTLATFFIPFSLVAGIFSMEDLREISDYTYGIYFAVAVPLAFVVSTVAFIAETISRPRMKKKLFDMIWNFIRSVTSFLGSGLAWIGKVPESGRNKGLPK